jgi:hypothetical protein
MLMKIGGGVTTGTLSTLLELELELELEAEL